jgi:hypothetical protein
MSHLDAEASIYQDKPFPLIEMEKSRAMSLCSTVKDCLRFLLNQLQIRAGADHHDSNAVRFSPFTS